MLFIQEQNNEQTGSGEIILTWMGRVEEQPGFPERVSTEQNLLAGWEPISQKRKESTPGREAADMGWENSVRCVWDGRAAETLERKKMRLK